MAIPALPIDFNAIRAAMVLAVRSACGLDANHVITLEPEVPNAPRPSLPYFTVKIVSPSIRFGNDSAEYVPPMLGGPPDVWNYGGPRGMMASFNAYAANHEDAYNYMALWQASLEQEPTQEILGAAGISVWKPSAISDLSMLLNTGFEGRAHMDCNMGLASNMTVTLGEIDTVTATGSVSVDGGTTQTITTTVQFNG